MELSMNEVLPLRFVGLASGLGARQPLQQFFCSRIAGGTVD